MFEVIEQQPRAAASRSTASARCGPPSITAGLGDQKAVREIMVFLQGHGVGTARAVRIYKTYGADAIQLVTENPYRLARDIRGIGFKTADAIAEKLGIAKTAMIRAQRRHLLRPGRGDGRGPLRAAGDELLPLAEKLLEVPTEPGRTALDLELAEGTVVADTVGETPCVFLPDCYRAERDDRRAAACGLRNGTLPWPEIEPTRRCRGSRSGSGFTLAAEPAAAIRLALMSKVLVITGGPGVGKTTLVNAILKILGGQGRRGFCCARRPAGPPSG